MKLRSVLSAAALRRLALLALFVGALCYLLPRAGTYLVRSSDALPRQGVFLILMGSIPDRALAAIDLYHDYPQTRQIWIVEENMLGLEFFREKGYKVLSNSQQMASILAQSGIPDSIIRIIPGLARSTLMEAKALDAWLMQQPEKVPDTLLLISSAAHMRRAGMIFDHVLNHRSGRNIYLATYPSPYSGYNAQRWYATKEDIQTTLSEYFKLLSFLLVERWR